MRQQHEKDIYYKFLSVLFSFTYVLAADTRAVQPKDKQGEFDKKIDAIKKQLQNEKYDDALKNIEELKELIEEKTIHIEGTVLEVDLESFVSECEENLIKAEKKYSDKTIKLNGPIHSVEKTDDYESNGFLISIGPSSNMIYVRCYFDESSENSLIDVKVGDEV